MAMGGLDVVVRFIGDASSIQAEAAKIEGTGARLKSWAKGVGAAIGGAFVLDQLRQATDAAAEFADTVGASQVIFGDSAAAVQRWANANASAFLMSKQEAIGAANTFATFGKAAGLTGKDLSGFATDLTGLAGDLASFRGGTTEEAITAIGAALRGESEPIRRYGVLLDDATLRARAFAMGISDGTSVLTPAQKTLAAQAEILAQTADAQGDAARTADSAANQQRKMAAEVKNAQVALGSALLPVLQAILPIVTKLATIFAKYADVLVPLAAVIGAVVAVQWAWNAAMAANPIGLIVIAIAALIAGIVLLIQNWDAVANAAGVAWDFILGLVQTVWNWIKDNWPLLLAILLGPFAIAVKLIIEHWDAIVAFFSGLPAMIAGWLSSLAGIIGGAFADAFHAVINAGAAVLTWFAELPGKLLGALAGLGADMFHKGVQIMGDFIEGMKSMFGKALDKLRSLAGDILDTLNPFGSPQRVAYYKGAEAMADFVRGVQSAAPRAALTISGLAPAAALGGAGGGGGGATTFNIDVHVAAGTSPAEVGAGVVDAIRQYERVAGKAWRS